MLKPSLKICNGCFQKWSIAIDILVCMHSNFCLGSPMVGSSIRCMIHELQKLWAKEKNTNFQVRKFKMKGFTRKLNLPTDPALTNKNIDSKEKKLSKCLKNKVSSTIISKRTEQKIQVSDKRQKFRTCQYITPCTMLRCRLQQQNHQIFNVRNSISLMAKKSGQHDIELNNVSLKYSTYVKSKIITKNPSTISEFELKMFSVAVFVSIHKQESSKYFLSTQSKPKYIFCQNSNL